MLSSGHECIKLENRRFGVFWTSYRTFFFINDVWPAVCLLFRGAARRGQNLMNPCTFSCLLWWRGCESIFFTGWFPFKLPSYHFETSVRLCITAKSKLPCNNSEKKVLQWHSAVSIFIGTLLFQADYKEHCQRHNGPEAWVHITSSYKNIDQVSILESRLSINFKIQS